MGIGVLIGIFLGFLIFSDDSHSGKDEEDMHSMHSMMGDMSSHMRGLSGDELDKVFLEDMIVHHFGAVEMAEILKEGTTRPELLQMADDIIQVQTKEIEMMKEWMGKWF